MQDKSVIIVVVGRTLHRGEFTTGDAQTGTVFGAYKTGIKAAREVYAGLAAKAIRSKHISGTRARR